MSGTSDLHIPGQLSCLASDLTGCLLRPSHGSSQHRNNQDPHPTHNSIVLRAAVVNLHRVGLVFVCEIVVTNQNQVYRCQVRRIFCTCYAKFPLFCICYLAGPSLPRRGYSPRQRTPQRRRGTRNAWCDVEDVITEEVRRCVIWPEKGSMFTKSACQV